MFALRSKPTHPVRQLTLSFGVTLLTLLLIGAGVYVARQINRQRLQMQTDGRIGTVWVAGITYGPNHRLSCANPLLAWLGLTKLPLLGSASSVQGHYHGEPGSLELWFAYKSARKQWPQLECHRVGRTAFVDDLGQAYHGFLDFQGDYVGVYLPGFDHAAHRLICTLQWMPRGHAQDGTVSSRPMAFTIDLPSYRRTLPRLAAGGEKPVTCSQGGVSVCVSAMRLSPTRETSDTETRELVFRLSIRGGMLADTNVDSEREERLALLSTRPFDSGRDTLSNVKLTLANPPHPLSPGHSTPDAPPAFAQPPQHGKQLTVLDSFGYPLLPVGGRIRPMLSLDSAHCIQDKDGSVWIAPVIGVGVGTKEVRLHLDVIPTQGNTASIPIDLLVPLQTSLEL